MQKISPLRASIEAINKFRTLKNDNNAIKENASNPFGVAFKGVFFQDVYESAKKAQNNLSLKDNLKNSFVKFYSTAAQKFAGVKENAVNFSGKIKESASLTLQKVKEFANVKIELNPLKYSVSNLQKQSVENLSSMLKAELKGA